MIALYGLRKWVLAALSGNIAGGVYSRVPSGAAKPYTVIASMTGVPWDTETEEGSEDTITLSLFDGPATPANVESIMAEIDDILHGTRFTLDGGVHGWLERDFTDTYVETVGSEVHWRGILRIRAHISE